MTTRQFGTTRGHHRRPLIILTYLLLFAFGAPVLEAQSTTSLFGNPAAGRGLFRDRGCISCHSIWGNGGTLGPDLATAATGASLQQLAGTFWNHTPRMIESVRARGLSWPTFTESELADVISYVYYVKLFDEPGDPALGERWFQEKRCVDCHQVGGSGGSVGGALDEYARYIAPIALAQGMWNHGEEMRARQVERGMLVPIFFGREVADIQAYIRSASTRSSRDVELLQPPDPENGARLFRAKGCVRCHAADGRGTATGPNLWEATERMSVSEIAGQLWNHSTQMAEGMRLGGITLPRFEGTEMADVIGFLYYLRFNDTEGDLEKGAALFFDQGCATCHTGNDASSVGPNLSRSRAVLLPLGLATAMWNHSPAMYDQTLVREDLEWPRFVGNEMRDLSLFLRSRASTEP